MAPRSLPHNLYRSSPRSDCERGQVGRLDAGDIQIRDFEKPALGLVSTVAPAVTVTSSPAGATTQRIDSRRCSSDSGKLASVGAGVGIPLLLAFLTTLYMLRRSIRRQKAMAKEQEQQQQQQQPIMAPDKKFPNELPENVASFELTPHIMAQEMSNGRK
ncbi:MAG: hypothetical protein Q9196_006141 [Gyalolechia fulgens]